MPMKHLTWNQRFQRASKLAADALAQLDAAEKALKSARVALIEVQQIPPGGGPNIKDFAPKELSALQKQIAEGN